MSTPKERYAEADAEYQAAVKLYDLAEMKRERLYQALYVLNDEVREAATRVLDAYEARRAARAELEEEK